MIKKLGSVNVEYVYDKDGDIAVQIKLKDLVDFQNLLKKEVIRSVEEGFEEG